MSEIQKDDILNSLKNVMDPDLHRDIVSLGMVKNINIDGKNVSFTVELTTPACPLKDKIKSDCIDAIKSDIRSVKQVTVEMTSNVRTHNDKAKNLILPHVKNTIAVASGKGGVGKSTVAVNLAAALSRDGAKVGLLDADIYGPSIPLMLGITDRPKAVNDNGEMKIIPLEKFGLKIMSIGFMIDDQTPVIWRGPMASGAVKQFMSDVNWGELDYLIFDLPPGTGDIQLTLVQTIPLTGAIIVTTPQEVSLIDARKGLLMFSRVNVPVFGIVENMSYFIAPDTGNKYDIFGFGGGSRLADQNKIEFLGGIPIDPRIRIGGDKGIPIVYDLPDTEFAGIIQDISRKLAAQVSINLIERAAKKVEIVLNDDN
jgi:ATP-binding protein involved in chromosome partitioning